MSETSEQVFFSGNGVQVTSARFVVNQQTYPMRNIAAVKPMHKDPSQFWWYIGLLVGLLFVAGSFGSPISWGGVIFGAAIFGFCIMAIRAGKTVHAIVITTSGSDIAAIQSTDQAHVRAVLDALNQAIVHRG